MICARKSENWYSLTGILRLMRKKSEMINSECSLLANDTLIDAKCDDSFLFSLTHSAKNLKFRLFVMMLKYSSMYGILKTELGCELIVLMSVRVSVMKWSSRCCLGDLEYTTIFRYFVVGRLGFMVFYIGSILKKINRQRQKKIKKGFFCVFLCFFEVVAWV